MTEDLTEKRMELVVGNDDLLCEILLRVPAESLLRCKCVSKHWHSVISDPVFCSNHTRIYQKHSVLGAYYYFHRYELLEKVQSVSFRGADRSLPTLEFLKSAFNSEPVIIHASKGLFLCWFGDEKPLAVCNLTTQKFTKLPQHLPFSCSEYHDAPSAYLHFDPKNSLHYKVVCVGSLRGAGNLKYYRDEEREEDYNEHKGPFYEIDIYSSESKTWKRKHFRTKWGFDLVDMALWNGAIHWMTHGDEDDHVRFEIDTETLISNPIPRPVIYKQNIIRYFEECSGHLFFIQIDQQYCRGFHILEINKNFGWNLRYIVYMMPIRNYFDEIFQSPDPMGYGYVDEDGFDYTSWKFCVLGMVQEEEKDDFSLLLALPGIIISYDLKRGTFKVLRNFPQEEFFLGYVYNYAVAFHFIPTLSPT